MANLTQCIRGGSQDMKAGFIISFNYDLELVEKLKHQIPHTHREWRENSKTWWISEQYENVLKEMFSNFYAQIYLQGKLL